MTKQYPPGINEDDDEYNVSDFNPPRRRRPTRRRLELHLFGKRIPLSRWKQISSVHGQENT